MEINEQKAIMLRSFDDDTLANMYDIMASMMEAQRKFAVMLLEVAKDEKISSVLQHATEDYVKAYSDLSQQSIAFTDRVKKQ